MTREEVGGTQNVVASTQMILEAGLSAEAKNLQHEQEKLELTKKLRFVL